MHYRLTRSQVFLADRGPYTQPGFWALTWSIRGGTVFLKKVRLKKIEFSTNAYINASAYKQFMDV